MPVSVTEWLARGEWSKRSEDFGAIDTGRTLGMAYRPEVGPDLWARWHALPVRRHLLRPLSYERRLLVFAALDWTAASRPLGRQQSAIVLAQIARVFEAIVHRFAPTERGWFAAPRVYLDLEGEPRLGFVRPAACAPLDEAAVVAIVRRAVLEVASADVQLPEAATLADLSGAVLGDVRVEPPRSLWSIAEVGLGHYYAGSWTGATKHLGHAVRVDPERRFAEVFDAVAAELSVDRARALRSEIEALQAAGDHRAALAAATNPAIDPQTQAWLAEVMPSLYYRADRLPEAIRASEAALAGRPGEAELHAILTHALLRTREAKRALASADAWIAACPDDGRAYLARGNALVKLGRPDDARAAFARVAPATETLAALFARRAVDLRASRDRGAAGTSFAMPDLVVPAHLAPLRDLVLANRIDDALAYLAERAADHAAQLLHAELLVHARRIHEALAILESLPGDRAHLARGYALLALERAAEALAAFEAIAGEVDARALREGGSRARDRLART